MSSSELTCGRCRAKVRAGTTYCPYCMLKLAPELEPEPEPAPSIVAPQDVAPSPRREGTGQDELLEAATRSLGGAPELVVRRGQVLHGYALWRQADQLVLLTLGFSELGRLPDVWEESGRGFELLVRIKGAAVPEWLFAALDGVLEHTFKVEAGSPVRLLPALWCESRAAQGLERLDTVNGLVRVVELLSPLGPAFSAEDGEPIPPLPPDDEHRRTQLSWQLEQGEVTRDYSLCGDVVVIDGRPERCASPKHAAQRFREALEQALRSPAKMRRVLRERRPRRTLSPARSLLEESFLRARDDAAAAGVYRDWLLEQGDPRGELAAWLEAGATDELDFFWQHDAAIVLGEWAELLPVASFTWTCGFVDSLLVPRSRLAREDFSAQVRGVLALPLFATLRGLRLEWPERHDLAQTWAALAGAPQAPRLTSLSLNEEGDEHPQDLSWTSLGDLGPLWSALPSMERLRVRGTSGTLGKVDHGRLHTLAIESTELTSQRVEELTRAKLPSLTALEVWTGADCDPARLEPLFERRGLTSFGLVNCDATQDVVRDLVRSPLFETLKTLSFARGGLQDGDVPTLIAAAGALKKLERFDVSENALSPESLRVLRRAIPNLVSDSQREDYGDEGERYVSVAE